MKQVFVCKGYRIYFENRKFRVGDCKVEFTTLADCIRFINSVEEKKKKNRKLKF